MHRLWAYSLASPGTWQTVVFQMPVGERVPGWVDEVLAACGVDPARVQFVTELTAFERLHVPQQGRVLRGATLVPGYDALFPLAPIAHDPSGPRHVYVSRAGHLHTGSYLGETLIEQRLHRARFAILRPETRPLAEVLTLLRSAEHIVITEGSAIHDIELIGRISAKVLVIGRRHGSKQRFGEVLRPLCKASFFGVVEPVPGLAWDDAVPRMFEAPALIPLAALIDRIAEQTGCAIDPPDQAEIDRAVAADLAAYMLHPQTSRDSSDAALGQALQQMRSNPALRAVLNRVSAIPRGAAT